MTTSTGPGVVELAKIGGGKTWHHVKSREYASLVELGGGEASLVTAVCGTKGKQQGELEVGVDERAVQHRGANVCANCRAGGSVLAAAKKSSEHEPTTTAGVESAEKENTMATVTKKSGRRAAAPKKTTAAAKKTAAAKTTSAAADAITAPQLRDAIAKAERAIGSQPARTEADLTPAKAEKAHKLGKSIAADRWLLKRAQAGKTSRATVEAMVARIQERVEARNSIRAAK